MILRVGLPGLASPHAIHPPSAPPAGLTRTQLHRPPPPCEIGLRSCHVREPDTWDGTSPLPVLLHFHGWGRQGTLTVQHNRIASGYVAENVVLLGPNGRGDSWDFCKRLVDLMVLQICPI